MWFYSCALVLASATSVDDGEVTTQTNRVAVLALIVGNNRSLDSSRPDLRYADDDALKNGLLFHAIGEPQNIEILTRTDTETELLFKGQMAIAAPPQYRALFTAAGRLKQRAQKLRQQQKKVVFYLAFAGHGDEDNGSGYLELEDQRLHRSDLIEIIRQVGPDQAHILLDSCNSFFVIHPRRPGGKVWTNQNQLSQQLSVAGVDVGVFLSTSAEAQVYEWSQLRSGIFSHVVRSGLFGGADANSNGEVTYKELNAFVDIASQGLKNQHYKPHLYVQQPKNTDVFLDLAAAQTRRLELSGFQGQTTLRDQLGIRLVDIYPEQGYSPRFILPKQKDLTVTTQKRNANGRLLRWEKEIAGVEINGVGSVSLSEMVPAGGSRSSSTLFAQLFSVPYGPSALVSHRQVAQRPTPEIIITPAQEQRLRTQLRLLSDCSRNDRWASIAMGLTSGFSLLAIGGTMFGLEAANTSCDNCHSSETSVTSVLGPLLMLEGALVAAMVLPEFWPTSQEEIYSSYVDDFSTDGAVRTQKANTAVNQLSSLSQSMEEERTLSAIVGGVTGAILLATGSGLMFWHYTDKRFSNPEKSGIATPAVAGVLTGFLGLVTMGAALVTPWSGQSNTELMNDVVQQDPESVAAIIQ